MIRTIIWFIYFWLFLIFAIPFLIVANYLLKKGKIKEHDELVYNVVSKWARSLLKLAGTKVTVIGEENVPKDGAVVFVGNHQGNFDVPIFLGCIDKPKAFIAKIEILKIPLISSWMKHFNCVFLKRDDMRQSLKVMAQAGDYLKQGYSMVIFPEGTRSKSDNVGEFKAGSLRLAVKAGVPIIPVTMNGSYKIMEQNGFILKPAKVSLIISKPIETKGLAKEEINELPEVVRSIIMDNIKVS